MLTLRTLALGVLCGVAIGMLLYRILLDDPSTLKSVQQAHQQLNQNYVRAIDELDLEQAALLGMMNRLDDYSELLDAEAYERLLENARGSFAGVGLRVAADPESFTVIGILPGSPAATSKITVGDHILAIDGTSVADWTLSELVKQLRGVQGESVRIQLSRPASPSVELDVVLQRTLLKSVYFRSRILDKQVAYIHAAQCYEELAQDIKKTLNAMTPRQARGLILDLRGNPGGTLTCAVTTVDLFIDESIAVSTSGIHGQEVFTTSKETPYENLPLAILVDGGTASAAEIVAGALQDYQRAKIIGSQTFGKGSVQTLLPPLANGSALKITTAGYLTPLGRSFNDQGLQPDFILSDTSEDLIMSAAIKAMALSETP